MADHPDFEELARSPYDDTPRSRNRLWWLVAAVVGALALAIGIWILASPQDDVVAEHTTDPVASGDGAPSTTSPDTAGTTTTTDPLDPYLGPEPQFEVVDAGYGYAEPLEPVEAGKTVISNWDARGTIDEQSREVVGRHPGFGTYLVVSTGTHTTVSERHYGAPALCAFLVDVTGGSSGDCVIDDADSHGLAWFPGSELFDHRLVWFGIPDDTSVAVLEVDGDAVAWQRPRGGVAAFEYQAGIGDIIELRLLDAQGNVIAVVDRERQAEPDRVWVEPIVGYGDYSAVDYFDVDWQEIQEVVVACLNDYGIAAELPEVRDTQTGYVPPIQYPDLTEEQARDALDLEARCRIGLNIPNPPGQTPEDMREHFDYLVELAACFLDSDIDVGPIPTFDEWTAQPTGTRWEPWMVLWLRYEDQYDEASAICFEQVPPPGYTDPP